ncbi:hypothetical protein O3M35_001838 [Rhynocoris fuscipes]|uniref:Sugar phosphate transporter domain-containing protein n=1 Tax=Rhynocoris fuscipes TaxID=488301 RepID=A0AAW1CRE8_9HEMI
MSTTVQLLDPHGDDDPPPPISSLQVPHPTRSSLWMKINSALFYAVSSFMIMVVNKSVLTSYGFPSFQTVAFGQMLTTVVVLYCAKYFGVISFPDLESKTFQQLSPLPFITVANMIFGLGGTKELSLPMFTMLRRFSILMTMLAEYWVLNVRQKLSVKISVALMIFGAIIAALSDLGFNLHGYVFVLLSDFLTAANGVYTKKILGTNKVMGKYGVMFYCSLFMLPFSAAGVCLSGDLALVIKYPLWSDPLFFIEFILSCSMGFILTYSVILCTEHNSALTTTIMGCLKNILVTYLGMFFIGGDYIFSYTNFVGISLSVVGSVLYSYVTFKPEKSKALGSSATMRI